MTTGYIGETLETHFQHTLNSNLNLMFEAPGEAFGNKAKVNGKNSNGNIAVLNKAKVKVNVKSCKSCNGKYVGDSKNGKNISGNGNDENVGGIDHRSNGNRPKASNGVLLKITI
jgi:hypothetical protein